MSSHHFVKEGQEPGLLIAGPIDSGFLFQLLEWSPKVVVLQEAVEYVISLGIKIDVVVCDHRHYESLEAALDFQKPVQFIVLDEKNPSLISSGLKVLAGQPHSAVNIIGEITKEEMKLLAGLSAMDMVIWDYTYRWTCCRSGQYRKWVAKGHLFVTSMLDNISIHADAQVEKSQHEGYMRIHMLHDGLVTFKSDQKIFWLGEYIN